MIPAGIKAPRDRSMFGRKNVAGRPDTSPGLGYENDRATRFGRVEGGPLQGPDKQARFEQAVLPHLDAAYNLARWLTRNDHDAQDVVQEAYLRAFRFWEGYHGGDARAWLLAIVRNTCFTWMQQNRAPGAMTTFDEEVHSEESDAATPETLLLQSADQALVRQALEELPVHFREVLVLRELEGLSYKEIADVAGIPLGTVMSSLARARKRLRESLASSLAKER
jgi:RNA polymerase sigma factor (sigma-70 family)